MFSAMYAMHSTERMSVRLPPEIMERVDELADQHDRSRSREVLAALCRWIEEHDAGEVDEWLKAMKGRNVEEVDPT